MVAESMVLGVAGNLAHSLVLRGAMMLRNRNFSSEETAALERAYQSAFHTMLSDSRARLLGRVSLQVQEEILRDFINDDSVARTLMEFALGAGEARLPELEESFRAFGGRIEWLPSDFGASMAAFVEGLRFGLQHEAEKPGSPLFNRVTSIRLDNIQTLLSQIRAAQSWVELSPADPYGDLEGIEFADDSSELGPPPVVEDPFLFVGRTVNRYLLREFVGEGGTGTVFRASHPDTGREVAVKLFYPLGGLGQEYEPVIRRGFRALGALKHPNIVEILDIGTVVIDMHTHFFLTMEFVDGLPLDRWSDGLGDDREGLTRRLNVAIQIAEALRAAHGTAYFDDLGLQNRGVLHGDIKPANVLVASGDRAKVIDFLLVDIHRLLDEHFQLGLVRAQFERRYQSRAWGTEGYMAPEQEDRGEMTVASDVFGLGVTLAELFLHGGPRSAYIFRAGKSDYQNNLVALVARMLAPAAAERPPSMEEVSKQLKRVRSKGIDELAEELRWMRADGRGLQAAEVHEEASYRRARRRVVANARRQRLPSAPRSMVNRA